MKQIYLVNIINKDLTKKPLFTTDDQTFGVNYFNQWKRLNGKDELLCQIEPIELIESADFKKTDILTSTVGGTNGNQETGSTPGNDTK